MKSFSARAFGKLMLSSSIICLTAFGQTSLSTAHNLQQSRNALLQFMRGGQRIDLTEKCGLPAISYAIVHSKELSPELTNDLRNVLDRPTPQKNILVGAFRIHYDTVGADAPAMLDSQYQRIPGTADQFADSVASIANYCRTFETQVLGYLPPPPDSGYGGGTEYDIYISDFGEYGETTPETPINNKGEGGTYTSFMRIDNDFSFVQPLVNRGLPALRVTLAHELHHAIQMGSYGYWYNDPYFYEMTSVWMEDVLFTQVNDYLQYVNSTQSQFQNPDVPFNSSSFIMYSRGVWTHYLAKRFGRDVVRRMWEEIPSAAPLTAMDNALAKPPYSSGFKSAFAEWTIWNYFTGARSDSVTYYPEGASYPDIKRGAVDFSAPASSFGGTLNALSSRYYLISSQSQSTPFVLCNVNLPAAVGGDKSTFPYTVVMNQAKSDDFSQSASSGFFLRLDVADPANWFSRLIGEAASVSAPFPNPFRADGSNEINIPVRHREQVVGNLSIYSSDMKLVFSDELSSNFVPILAEQAFRWNGKSNSNIVAGSGIYLYVLELPNETIKGKFVLLRK